MKLTDAIEGFFLEKRLRFSKRTIEGYRYHLAYFVTFLGDVEFGGITSDDVRRFLDWLHTERGLSKRSVHDSWIVLSSLWTWGEGEGFVVHIIRRKVGQPEFTEKAIEIFTRDQVKQLVKAVSQLRTWTTSTGKVVTAGRPCVERDKAIVLTLLDSGIRASELCALTVGDYDTTRGRLHIRHGKGDKGRFVFLGDRTRKAIWRYLVTRGGKGGRAAVRYCVR